MLEAGHARSPLAELDGKPLQLVEPAVALVDPRGKFFDSGLGRHTRVAQRGQLALAVGDRLVAAAELLGEVLELGVVVCRRSAKLFGLALRGDDELVEVRGFFVAALRFDAKRLRRSFKGGELLVALAELLRQPRGLSVALL